MSAVLLGSFSLGDALPGVKDSLGQTGEALTDLKGVVDGALDVLTTIQGGLDGLANDLDSAKDELITGPVDELQNAIDAAQALLVALGDISDPFAYLDSVLLSLTNAITALTDLGANDYLDSVIAGVNGGIDGQQARLDALVGTVTNITDISSALSEYTSQLGALKNTLQAASDRAINGIIAYTEQVSEMLNTGVYVVSYTGPLSGLGSAVDAVTPDTGIGGSTQVAGPLLIVETANTATLTALNNVYGL